jgi:hypothetical protein
LRCPRWSWSREGPWRFSWPRESKSATLAAPRPYARSRPALLGSDTDLNSSKRLPTGYLRTSRRLKLVVLRNLKHPHLAVLAQRPDVDQWLGRKGAEQESLIHSPRTRRVHDDASSTSFENCSLCTVLLNSVTRLNPAQQGRGEAGIPEGRVDPRNGRFPTESHAVLAADANDARAEAQGTLPSCSRLN